MTPLVLGIDSGSTATKVSVYDQNGRVVAFAAAPTPRSPSIAGRMERDPEEHWRSVAAVVARAVADPSVDPPAIRAIGITAQGDGLILIDADGAPVGPAILSSDSRATSVVDRWRHEGVLDALLPIIGQTPFPGSPAALLRWMVENDPERVSAASHALASKDWLRYRMTGNIGTERTDAGAAFTDVMTQSYSTEALKLYGLDSRGTLLPPSGEPAQIRGAVSAEAALLLNIPAGVPVVAGLHDVIATVVGSVGVTTNALCVVAGTFGVNVVLDSRPTISPAVNSRPGPQQGLWAPRRTSRASAANVDWAVGVLRGPHDTPPGAVNRVLARPSTVDAPLYLPFLFGGNDGQPDAASFVGVRGWHTSDDLLRAVLEGITFNHRLDVELLAEEVPVSSLHVAGGVSQNDSWLQLFADVFGRPVTAVPGDDAGARGAAMCAAVGAGLYRDLEAASAGMAAPRSSFNPGDASTVLDASFASYRDAYSRVAQLELSRTAVPSLSV